MISNYEISKKILEKIETEISRIIVSKSIYDCLTAIGLNFPNNTNTLNYGFVIQNMWFSARESIIIGIFRILDEGDSDKASLKHLSRLLEKEDVQAELIRNSGIQGLKVETIKQLIFSINKLWSNPNRGDLKNFRDEFTSHAGLGVYASGAGYSEKIKITELTHEKIFVLYDGIIKIVSDLILYFRWHDSGLETKYNRDSKKTKKLLEYLAKGILEI